jgi:hypothetical protein
VILQLMQKTNIKAVHVLSGSQSLKLALAGQSPRAVMEVAYAAVDFCKWVCQNLHTCKC